MIEWNEFKACELVTAETEVFLVKCEYGACNEPCVAYIGDNNYFYSMETHKILPVTHWSFWPEELNLNASHS